MEGMEKEASGVMLKKNPAFVVVQVRVTVREVIQVRSDPALNIILLPQTLQHPSRPGPAADSHRTHASSVRKFILYCVNQQFLFDACSIVSLNVFLCHLLLGHWWRTKHRRVPERGSDGTSVLLCRVTKYLPSSFRWLQEECVR
jgi:hypothetical protein